MNKIFDIVPALGKPNHQKAIQNYVASEPTGRIIEVKKKTLRKII